MKSTSLMSLLVLCSALILGAQALADADNTIMPKNEAPKKLATPPAKPAATKTVKAKPAKQKPTVVVFMGAPGSGKGTQAAMLSKKMGVPHISTGDLLRAEVAKGTALGKQAGAIMKKGELVPDEMVLTMLQKRASQRDCNKGYLIDGFPRTEAQAKMLDMWLKERTNMVVVNLDVKDNVIMERIAGRAKEAGDKKRADDNPESVKERLAQYHKNTQPLMATYEEQKRLINIDGSEDIDSIHKHIWEEVQKRQSAGAPAKKAG